LKFLLLAHLFHSRQPLRMPSPLGLLLRRLAVELGLDVEAFFTSRLFPLDGQRVRLA